MTGYIYQLNQEWFHYEIRGHPHLKQADTASQGHCCSAVTCTHHTSGGEAAGRGSNGECDGHNALSRTTSSGSHQNTKEGKQKGLKAVK